MHSEKTPSKHSRRRLVEMKHCPQNGPTVHYLLYSFYSHSLRRDLRITALLSRGATVTGVVDAWAISMLVASSNRGAVSWTDTTGSVALIGISPARVCIILVHIVRTQLLNVETPCATSWDHMYTDTACAKPLRDHCRHPSGILLTPQATVECIARQAHRKDRSRPIRRLLFLRSF